MKHTLITLLAITCFISCNDSDIETPTEKEIVAVELTISNFDISLKPMENTSRQGDNYQNPKGIICTFVDKDSIIVAYTISYSEEDKENFGKIKVDLPEGKYTVYTTANDQKYPSGEYKVDLPIPIIGEHVKAYHMNTHLCIGNYIGNADDALFSRDDIVVSKNAQYPPIILDRIIGRVEFDITDILDYTNIKYNEYFVDIFIMHNIYSKDYFLAKDPHEQQISEPTSTGGYEEGWLHVGYFAYWQHDAPKIHLLPISFYGLGDIETSIQIQLDLEPTRIDGSIVKVKRYIKEIHGVKIQNNKITTIKGSMFENSKNLIIDLDKEWDKEAIEIPLNK